MQQANIVIDPRFRGPPRSGNGGYVAGVVASVLPGVVEVTLRLPPPLQTPMTLSYSDQAATLYLDDKEVANARTAELELEIPSAPTFAESMQASQRYTGFEQHNFPQCFVCGPDREDGDGLRIFPGALADRPGVAAPWTPGKSLLGRDTSAVGVEFVWSALDCPGYFGLRKNDFAALLGRMTAQVIQSPEVGQRCIVMGWPIREDGRKLQVGSGVFSESGELMACAKATWIQVDPSKYNQ